MVIGDKPTSETFVTSRNKYSIKNSFLRDTSSNCETQNYSLEGEVVSKLKTIFSGKMFKGSTTIEEINEKFSSWRYGEFTDILDKDISDEISTLLYIISVYTINNCKATAGPKNCSFPELYQYLDHIIPLGKKNKSQCFETASNLKPPDFILDVKIVEALRLKWNKHLECSRLFCKLWISSNPEIVEFTKPVDYPIHPEWNASYKLEVKHPEGNSLIIEIRQVIVKKCKSHFQKSESSKNGTAETTMPHKKQKDCLFGWCEVRLSDIFCEGIDTWVPVKSIKNERIKGCLHIATKIGISRENGEICALKRHFLLLRLCLEDCLKTVDSEKIISSWEDIVSSKASTLLHLHSVIEGIPICEDTISWFVVINHIALKNHIFSIQFTYNLLLGCKEILHQLSCVKGSLNSSLETTFNIEVEILNKRCLKLLGNLHSLDLTSSKCDRNDFEYSLRIIQISNEFCKLRNDPVSVMKSEALKWLAKVAENIPTQISDKISYLIEFMETTKDFLDVADRIIVKVYSEVLYTGAIFNDLDEFFQKNLKANINEIVLVLTSMTEEKDQLLKDVLRLFESSKNLLLYINKVTKDQIFEEKFESLCLWFGDGIIENWFNWKTRVAICQIKMVLCFDDFMGMNTCKFGFAKEKISSTAKVIPDIFRKHLVELWHIVSNMTFSNYNQYFINSLNDCSALFVSGLLNKSPMIFLGADKRKATRKKLYVVANDLNFLSSFVGQITSNTVKTLPADIVDPKAFLSDAIENISAAICKTLLVVANKRIENVIEAGNKLKQKLAMLNYVSLMEKKIWNETNRYLTSDAFAAFFLSFVQSILEIIQNHVNCHQETEQRNKIPKKIKYTGKQSKLIFEGLLEVSKETEKLCSGVRAVQKQQLILHNEFIEIKRKLISILDAIETS